MITPPRKRKTLTGWFAIGFHVFGFLLIAIAMFSRNWLQAENKAYGTAMNKIGLWVQCFRSLNVPEDTMRETLFTGCRWIFDPFTRKYDEVQAWLQAPFFVTTQVFFTFCFTFALIGFVFVGILVLCPGEDFELLVLKAGFIDLFASFFFGFIAVTVFGAMATDREWMPHPEHNLLSWSYALAVIGVVADFVAAILFYVEYKIQKRKDSYRQSHGVFTLEGKK